MPSDEIKSVYVRNLSPTVSASEIEEELKNFGRIRPDGVVIRSRKVGFYIMSPSILCICIAIYVMCNFKLAVMWLCTAIRE